MEAKGYEILVSTRDRLRREKDRAEGALAQWGDEAEKRFGTRDLDELRGLLEEAERAEAEAAREYEAELARVKKDFGERLGEEL